MAEKTNQPKRRAMRRVVVCSAVVIVAGAALLGCQYYYHQVIRKNFRAVAEGQVYRSAQPSPAELKEWARQHGFKTVVNLRGASTLPFYQLEQAAAREAGLELINVQLQARSWPPQPAVSRLIEVLETGERPILLHCRSGVDRTGFASAIAAMAIGGQDYATAKGQLRIGIFRHTRGGRRIGGLMEQYEQHCRKRGTGTGDWEQFRRWVIQDYRVYYYYVDIAVPQSLHATAGATVTVEVTITNRSPRTIPAGDSARQFNLSTFVGTCWPNWPDREYGHRTPLPKRNIAPGESVSVVHRFEAPDQPGRLELKFDLVEENRTWFSRQGSPTPTCILEIHPNTTTRVSIISSSFPGCSSEFCSGQYRVVPVVSYVAVCDIVRPLHYDAAFVECTNWPT